MSEVVACFVGVPVTVAACSKNIRNLHGIFLDLVWTFSLLIHVTDVVTITNLQENLFQGYRGILQLFYHTRSAPLHYNLVCLVFVPN